MFVMGKVQGKALMEMPKDALEYSISGKVYHVHIKTTGVTNEQKVANMLSQELQRRFNIKTAWVRIENGLINMQITGSPFAWALLIPFIPSILSVLGIAVVLLSVYSVIASIPSWAWALLITGVGVIILGPHISRAISGGYERYVVEREKS